MGVIRILVGAALSCFLCGGAELAAAQELATKVSQTTARPDQSGAATGPVRVAQSIIAARDSGVAQVDAVERDGDSFLLSGEDEEGGPIRISIDTTTGRVVRVVRGE